MLAWGLPPDQNKLTTPVLTVKYEVRCAFSDRNLHSRCYHDFAPLQASRRVTNGIPLMHPPCLNSSHCKLRPNTQGTWRCRRSKSITELLARRSFCGKSWLVGYGKCSLEEKARGCLWHNPCIWQHISNKDSTPVGVWSFGVACGHLMLRGPIACQH